MRQIFTLTMAALLIAASSYAENVSNKPAKINIPELKQMHKLIHPMWHKGYPEKDYDLLKSLYPDLASQFKILTEVQFPAQYPDRKMHWTEGLEKMQIKLQQYQQAIKEQNNEKLLTAVRELHACFEGLVRIVHPPIPELDQFHQVLFHVYHDYLPNENWEKLDESIDQFEQKMTKLNEVNLPEWMTDKNDEFDRLRKDLNSAVEDLAKLKNSNKPAKINKAVERVHSAYKAIESIFE